MDYVKCTSCSEWITKEELFKKHEEYIRREKNWHENVIQEEIRKYETNYYVFEEREFNNAEELEAYIIMEKLNA